jgi:hypothetical protein
MNFGTKDISNSCQLQYCLTPGITEKKVPPRHQSRYIGSTLNVVYRKLKAVESPITFAIGSQGVEYHVIRAHRSLQKFCFYGYQRTSICLTSHYNPIRFLYHQSKVILKKVKKNDEKITDFKEKFAIFSNKSRLIHFLLLFSN